MKIIFQRFLNKLLKPYSIVVFTVALSVMAWFYPSGSDVEKGFTKAEPFTFTAFFIISAWYLLIVAFSFTGFRLGRKIKPFEAFDRFANFENEIIYKIYSYIGFLGFAYSLIQVFKVYDFQSLFLKLFIEFQGNLIQEALYEDYSIGLASLRYILIIGFGLALYKIQVKKSYHFFNFFNIFAFLIYTVIFGRRLQIIEAILIYLVVANRDGDFLKKIKSRVLYLSVISFFSLVCVATVVRNFNTYSERGQNNAITATLANILEYLGTPFQASLEVANHMEKATHGVDYSAYTSIDPGLTTNAAFTQLITGMSLWIFPFISIVCFVYAFISGILFNNKNNYLFIGYPILLYAFAELWRIFLFETGIFFTLIIVSIIVPAFYVMWKKCLASPIKSTYSI